MVPEDGRRMPFEQSKSWWGASVGDGRFVCELSGEEIARLFGGDGGNWRARIRKGRVRFPELSWWSDPRQVPNPRFVGGEDVCLPPKAVRGREVETYREVCAGDFHVPYHDLQAVGILLGYLKDNPPDGFTLGGDFADFYQVSKFNKDPQRALELQNDLDMANAVLDAIDTALPDDCTKRFLVGNHEVRMENYLKGEGVALTSLKCLRIESLLRLDERGYEVVPMVARDSSVFIGAVEVGHFDKVCKHSAYTEKLLMDDRGCSLMQFHTHRRGAHYRRLRGTGEELGGWGPGCMCDLNPEYCSKPNWHQGFATITTTKGSDRFHVDLHEIIGGELLVGNVRY